MEPIFDIGFVTSHLGTTNIGHYFGLLKTASNSELQQFKKQVISHSEQNQQNGAFRGVPNYSTHKAIISAINHEKLKRSWRYKVFKIIFPIRKWFVRVFSGIELSEHEVFGPLYSVPKLRLSRWHLSHTELLIFLKRFWCNHWFKLLIAFSTVGAFVVALLAYLDS